MAGDWGAKHLLLAAVALVCGLALGGLAPRSEIRGLRGQLAEQGDRGERRRDVGRELATVFRGRPWEGDEGGEGAPAAAVAETPTAPPPPDGESDEVFDAPDEVPEEGLDAMRDAMELRSTQARAALAQQAEASDEQMVEIDAVVAAMNADLHDLAAEAVVKFRESGGEPDRHDLMVFAAGR